MFNFIGTLPTYCVILIKIYQRIAPISYAKVHYPQCRYLVYPPLAWIQRVKIKLVGNELWHNKIGIICWYILMKFTQYVGKVPMKWNKIVLHYLNCLFSNYICFPNRCVSFAFRCICPSYFVYGHKKHFIYNIEHSIIIFNISLIKAYHIISKIFMKSLHNEDAHFVIIVRGGSNSKK